MESIPQVVSRLVEGLKDFCKWEEEVTGISQEIASEIGSMVIRAMDDALMKEREEGLSVVGMRERTIMTMFGPLKIERRLYRDEQGNYRFLLDEAPGFKPRAHFTPALLEVATELSSNVTFVTPPGSSPAS